MNTDHTRPQIASLALALVLTLAALGGINTLAAAEGAAHQQLAQSSTPRA
jgi:hypothetical protein